MNKVVIGDKLVGPGRQVFIIAEAGVNHNGDPLLARRLIREAAAAGADAVKFQTFRAARLVTAGAGQARYQQVNSGRQESQLAMLKRLELTAGDHGELQQYAAECGILFLSTPFDEESLELLCQLKIPAFKIGSGELNNHPFLQQIAHKACPIILSTGMSYLWEVQEAVEAICATGNRQLVLLHCTSNYPPAMEDVNLRAITTLQRSFPFPIGYSDHTPGDVVAIGAVTLGAAVIEKHLTLDKALPGPDHLVSLEPGEFKEMVDKIRVIERALGSGEKLPACAEEEIRLVARKSLVARREIPAGTKLALEDVAIKRPGSGLPPKTLTQVLGRKTKVRIPEDELIAWDMLEEPE